ncbi:hypothetical protein MHBO_004413 [Bonamia ostreae]|uniref:Uncharacterized protein n=1 Tax=Bonamia ostreae TaxID=126728 RepID=A0ABV2AT86_9EUKA
MEAWTDFSINGETDEQDILHNIDRTHIRRQSVISVFMHRHRLPQGHQQNP